MTERLSQRRILLTGVSRGIGLESARVLLREGADLLGVARNPDRLDTAARELERLAPGRFQPLCLNLEEPGAGAQLVAAVQDKWGALDVLINNAGIQKCFEPGGITSEPVGALEETLEFNLLMPYRVTRALIPLLEKGKEPRVVHVSSDAGTLEGLRNPGIGAYRLSKWALNGLTMLQAHELEGRIAVNALDPGWVKTDLGGPLAPGHPTESAASLLQMLLADFSVTGKLFRDGRITSY